MTSLYRQYPREHNIWSMMKQRCTNPKAANYNQYGAQGVSFCTRWDKFANFFADMGPAPSPQHTLDRVDSAGDYGPENCRWADVETQQNNRRNGRKYEKDGALLSAPQLVRAHTGDTNVARLSHRLQKLGMGVEEALSCPKMSWVQRPVVQKTSGGAFVALYGSLADAAKALATQYPEKVTPGQNPVTFFRARVWSAVKLRRKYLDFLWEYAA